MTRRQEAAMETRRRLMDAGERLISASGSSTVTVDDIARECGVARGTFYIYFRNMADLVESITRQPYRDIESELEDMEASGAPLMERMDHYVHQFMEKSQRYGIKIAQQWIRNMADPDAVPAGNDGRKLDFDREAARRVLGAAVSRGELSEDMPVDDVADLMMTQLYGVLTCWCMSGGRMDSDSLLDSYITLQLEPMLRPFMTGRDAE